jgi:threonine dehydrogenase-like Zn-dependent dehydrogenase
MDALIWNGGRNVAMGTAEEPVPGPDGLLFEPELAGICGSDLHGYRGHPGPRRPPLILGHEAVGTVPGRDGRFVVFPLVVCGKCAACLRGEENLCETRGLLGLDRHGVFAERTAVTEDQLVPLPAGVEPLAGTLVEPMAATVAALRYEDVERGQRVAIIGCGPIGLLGVYACRAAGLEVTVAEPLTTRRETAQMLGATESVSDVADLPPGSFDVVLDCAGFDLTWNAGVAAARTGGSVVLIGLGDAVGTMPAADLVRRGVRIRGHYAYARRDFDTCLDILARHELPLDWVSVAPLADGADAFRQLVDEPSEGAKVVLAVAPATVPV